MPDDVPDAGAVHPAEHDSREVRHARDSAGHTPSFQTAAGHLGELARELQAEPDMDSLLQHIVEATVREIDGAAYGGITLVEGRSVRAVASTQPVVSRLDELQNEIDDGPCLSSLRDQVTVRADDFATEQRWPKFVAAAVDDGIRSMLSVQLFVEDDNLGALNIYATQPRALDEADEYTAIAMAAHAAVAMKGSRVENDLRAALVSRDIIGQGKGILMERYKVSADEAFQLLVVASQTTHLKLRDIAEHLAATGELRVN